MKDKYWDVEKAGTRDGAVTWRKVARVRAPTLADALAKARTWLQSRADGDVHTSHITGEFRCIESNIPTVTFAVNAVTRRTLIGTKVTKR